MDHILRHSESNLPRIEVPYVCEGSSICAPEEYPYLLDDLDIWFSSGHNVSFDEVIRRIQVTLYFGLLSCFLGTDVDPKSVVSENDSRQLVIDSRRVVNLLKNFEKEPDSVQFNGTNRNFSESPESEAFDKAMADARTEESWGKQSAHIRGSFLAARNKELRAILLQVYEIMNRHVVKYLLWSEYDSDSDLWTEQAFAVIFAVDVLIDLLEAALSLPPDSFGLRDLRRPCIAASSTVIANSIRKSGRCPSLAWSLQPSSTEWYRLLFLPPAVPRYDHSLCNSKNCSKPNSAATEHRHDCNGCGFLPSDINILRQCIMGDAIPLIQYTKDDSGRVKVETVAGTLLSEYTAISHVWAGGLGNEKENALPECQLRYLTDALEALPPATDSRLYRILSTMHSFGGALRAVNFHWERYLPSWSLLAQLPKMRTRPKPVLFWLDSLCIPALKDESSTDPNAQELRALKAKAIHSMAQIYSGAAKVLVLDPELRELNIDTDNDQDSIALQIKASPWMGRSWPLQEGALTENLYFQFKDKAILLENVTHRDINLPVTHMLQHDTEIISGSMAGQLPSNFTDVWNGLVKRKTKEAKDLPAILAATLGSSAEEVLGIHVDMRMKAIIKAQTKLPLALIFQPNCVHDGRWHPQIPGADPAQSLIQEFDGSLRFDNGVLVLENAGDTIGILVENKPNRTHFDVAAAFDDGTSEQYTVQLEPKKNTSSKSKEFAADVQTLLLLSPLCIVGTSMFSGAYFSVKNNDGKQLEITLTGSLMWTMNRTAPRCEEDGRAMIGKGLRGSAWNEIAVKFDIGIKDGSWPTLRWSRKSAIPIASSAQISHTIWIVSLYLTAAIYIPYFGFAFNMIDLGDDPWHYKVSPERSLLTVWIYVIFFSPINNTNNWLQWLTRRARQPWAASFHDNPTSQSIVERSSQLTLFLPPFPIKALLLRIFLLSLMVPIYGPSKVAFFLPLIVQDIVQRLWLFVFLRMEIEELTRMTKKIVRAFQKHVLSFSCLALLPATSFVTGVALGSVSIQVSCLAFIFIYPLWVYLDLPNRLDTRGHVLAACVLFMYAGITAIFYGLETGKKMVTVFGWLNIVNGAIGIIITLVEGVTFSTLPIQESISFFFPKRDQRERTQYLGDFRKPLQSSLSNKTDFLARLEGKFGNQPSSSSVLYQAAHCLSDADVAILAMLSGESQSVTSLSEDLSGERLIGQFGGMGAAFSHLFVLHALLSWGHFLHIGWKRSEENDNLVQRYATRLCSTLRFHPKANRYATRGYEGALRALLHSEDSTTCKAVLTAATFLCLTELARGPWKGSYMFFDKNGKEPNWVSLLKHLRSTMNPQELERHLEPRPYKFFSSYTSSGKGCRERELLDEEVYDHEIYISNLCSRLMRILKELLLEDAPQDRTASSVYLEAQKRLASTIEVVFKCDSDDTEDRHIDIRLGLLQWLLQMDDDFIAYLQRKEDLAIVIFATSAVLFKRFEVSTEGRSSPPWASHIFEGARHLLGFEHEQVIKSIDEILVAISTYFW